MFGMGLYEKHLEGRFQVSVRRVFCHSWSKLVSVLVSYCCSFAFFFLWIYNNVPSLLGHSWLHPFRPVFDLLLLRLRKEICHVETINLHDATSLLLSASYAKRNAVSNAIGYAKFYSRSRDKTLSIGGIKRMMSQIFFVVDGSSFVTSGPVGPTSTVGGTCIAMCARNLAAPSRMEVINRGQCCTEG